MKALSVSLSLFLAIMLIVPQQSNSQGSQGARGAVIMDSTAPTHAGPGPAAGAPSYGGGTSAAAAASADSASSASAGTGSYAGYYGGGSWSGAPNLQNTSFGSYVTYQDYYNYYYYLCSHFNLNPAYFDRFYRHTEPLITPEMLRLTLRTPVRLSSRMLDAIDQLEAMLKAIEEGKAVDRKALLAKSKEIRDFAKQIRSNQTLRHFDLRENRDLLKQDENNLNVEALARMRDMAVDLDRQLRDLYGRSETSTISVESYKQPSLESLAKGIEKLCKNIEKSAKNI